MKQYLKSLIIIAFLLLVAIPVVAKERIIKINCEPAESAIYVDNVFVGNGYAEFTCPKKKNMVAIIKIECDGYRSINTKFYGGDKRESLSYKMVPDGFMQGSVASGIVNKFFTIQVDKQYYTVDENGQRDLTSAWKMLHHILLNYYDEIETTDFSGGYIQTAWDYSKFSMSDRQIRTRVVIRDISTPDRVAYQIKVSSEVAGALGGKHGEFVEIDRIPKRFEPLIQELQTRIGKLYNL